MSVVHWDRIYDMALSDLSPPCRLLDVACGTGMLVEKAKAQGLDATGIDCCLRMLNRAQERVGGPIHNGHFSAGSAYTLPFCDNMFDVVICTGAITGMDRAISAMQEMKRVCKPGGLIRVVDYWCPEQPKLYERIWIVAVKNIRKVFYPMSELFRAADLVMVSRPIAYWGCVRIADARKPAADTD